MEKGKPNYRIPRPHHFSHCSSLKSELELKRKQDFNKIVSGMSLRANKRK